MWEVSGVCWDNCVRSGLVLVCQQDLPRLLNTYWTSAVVPRHSQLWVSWIVHQAHSLMPPWLSGQEMFNDSTIRHDQRVSLFDQYFIYYPGLFWHERPLFINYAAEYLASVFSRKLSVVLRAQILWFMRFSWAPKSCSSIEYMLDPASKTNVPKVFYAQ